MEILNQTVINDTIFISGWWWLIVAAPFVILTFLAIIKAEETYFAGGLGTSIILAFLMMIVWVATSKQVPTERYRYEVVLNNKYSATEMLAKYNVVEQRGQIWVIEDKE
jgi:hypothetical protein